MSIFRRGDHIVVCIVEKCIYMDIPVSHFVNDVEVES